MTYPPKTWIDIFEYDDDEIVAGYREYRVDDPEPGTNRSDGYRWGWANRKKDATGIQDGHEQVRSEFIQHVPFVLNERLN